jgi:hypothetical protein
MEDLVARSRWLLLALSALLLAGPLVQDGHAKKPKTFFKAVVDGRKLKGSKLGRGAIVAATSFSVYGATKPKRGIVRTLQIVCGPVDLGAVPPGTTLTGCYGDLTEAGGRTGSFRNWSGPGVDVTVDAFDGVRVSGSFHGVLVNASSANPTPAPAIVEDGTFSVEQGI